MSKVTKPISKMAYTRGLILMFLQTRGRPARTSEIRQAVLQCYAEAAVYGCIGFSGNLPVLKAEPVDLSRYRDARAD